MKITLDSRIEEIVLKYPSTVEIFFKYGIPCIACGEPMGEQ
jgi:iron-sulfur cluster repair protein YtfE (RIC family)